MDMERVNRFGTSNDMIIQEMKEDGVVKLLAIDTRGLYLTTRDRVDTGMADVNRYGVDRKKTLALLESQGLSPVDVFEENRDKIKVLSSGQDKKKLNPLKASKRGL